MRKQRYLPFFGLNCNIGGSLPPLRGVFYACPRFEIGDPGREGVKQIGFWPGVCIVLLKSD